jgi:uncharacterized membrane protein
MVTNRAARIALVVLEGLMGLAAVASGPALIATNGLGMPTAWLNGSPFVSYTVPGLVLLAVGILNLAAAFAVLLRRRWGAPLSVTAGLMWIGWFVVQVAVVGFVSWQQPVYFAVGVLILTLSIPSLAGWSRPGPMRRYRV